jgi:peptidoglycan/xylan/chitin deacetylase (PgdA/CDA1 family)
MSLRSKLGDIHRGVLCAFYRRVVHLGDRGPIISFTFDDFPRTACSTGAAILEKFGARGTYYVTFGLMNRQDQLGELFNVDDLRILLERGHDLGTHTFSHCSCRSVSLEAFRRDIEKGQKAVEDFVGHNSINFAYPYGDVTLRVKKSLAPCLNSCRSIIPGFNGAEIDLNLLRANRLYGDIDQLAFVEKLIQENARRRSWLIFYTHDVRLNPSPYGCTPALLDSAVSLAALSGARILTVTETLAELRIDAGHHI